MSVRIEQALTASSGRHPRRGKVLMVNAFRRGTGCPRGSAGAGGGGGRAGPPPLAVLGPGALPKTSSGKLRRAATAMHLPRG
ncbi:hypothetical protein [Nocardia gipuzkoensis]|uniref:hypothetical protein n=1 Tax=Nocardia gipuzkoensis TaxID=2749991 RepID=UPI00245378A4|nr:hypothetical protein [Nocardia gipuzkoensis]